MTSFAMVLRQICRQIEGYDPLQTFCHNEIGFRLSCLPVFSDPDNLGIEAGLPRVLVTRTGMKPATEDRPEGWHEVHLFCCFNARQRDKQDFAFLPVQFEELCLEAVMHDPTISGLAIKTVFRGSEGDGGEDWPFSFTDLTFDILHRRSCSYV